MAVGGICLRSVLAVALLGAVLSVSPLAWSSLPDQGWLPGVYDNADHDDVDVVKGLANDRRLQILHWLELPRAHFPPQVDGDPVRDGVWGVLMARKLGISQPTASEHLKVLSRAGLVRPRRIKQWTF